MKGASYILASAVVVGCSRGGNFLPAESGMQWTYAVRTPYVQHVEEATFAESTPVGSSRGMTLKSRFGVSRIGWDKGRVVLAASNASVFEPPLPLLSGSGGKDRFFWKGRIQTANASVQAEAEIVQEPDEVTANGKEFKTLRSTVRLVTQDEEIEVISWFAAGVGLVRQEQRSGGKLELRMEWMSGPRTEKR